MEQVATISEGAAIVAAILALAEKCGPVRFTKACRVLSDYDYLRWAAPSQNAPLPALAAILPRGMRACEAFAVPQGLLAVPNPNFAWYAVRSSLDSAYNVRSTTWILAYSGVAVLHKTTATGKQGSPLVGILSDIRELLRNKADRRAIAAFTRCEDLEAADAFLDAKGGVFAEWAHPEGASLVLLRVKVDIRGAVYPEDLRKRARYFHTPTLLASAHRESFARLNSLISFAFVAAFDPQIAGEAP